MKTSTARLVYCLCLERKVLGLMLWWRRAVGMWMFMAFLEGMMIELSAWLGAVP